MIKLLCLTSLLFLILLLQSFTTAVEIDVNDPQNMKELYIVAPQGRLYRAKRQWGDYGNNGGFGSNFGASASNANSQSLNYSPQGFDASQSLSGSQTYNFGGKTLSVGYAGSYSANNEGASGSFAPTYSWSR